MEEQKKHWQMSFGQTGIHSSSAKAAGRRKRKRAAQTFFLSFFSSLSLSLALISSALSLAMMSVYQWLTALLKRNAEHGRFWPARRREGGEGRKWGQERERDIESVWERERGRSVSLAGFAAHLSEVCAAAKFEPEHQGAVCHCVHIFTLCRTQKQMQSVTCMLQKKKTY